MKSTVLSWKNKVFPTIFSGSLRKCEVQWGYFQDLSCKFRGTFWLGYMQMFSGGKGWPWHLLPRHWHQVSCLAGLGIFLLCAILNSSSPAVNRCSFSHALWCCVFPGMLLLGLLCLLVRLSCILLDSMCTSRSAMSHLVGPPWYRAEEWSL